MLKPLARGRALRALAEGAHPTLDLLAQAGSVSLRQLRRRAKDERWVMTGTTYVEFAARFDVLRLGLAMSAETIGQKLQAGEPVTKVEIDRLLSGAKAVRELEQVCRLDERVQEEKQKNDDTLAAVLDRINDRILTLAAELAAQMVEQLRRDGRSSPSPQ